MCTYPEKGEELHLPGPGKGGRECEGTQLMLWFGGFTVRFCVRVSAMRFIYIYMYVTVLYDFPQTGGFKLTLIPFYRSADSGLRFRVQVSRFTGLLLRNIDEVPIIRKPSYLRSTHNSTAYLKFLNSNPVQSHK